MLMHWGESKLLFVKTKWQAVRKEHLDFAPLVSFCLLRIYTYLASQSVLSVHNIIYYHGFIPEY